MVIYDGSYMCMVIVMVMVLVMMVMYDAGGFVMMIMDDGGCM